MVSNIQIFRELFTAKRKVLPVRTNRGLFTVTIVYVCIAVIFELLISSWVRSWIQGSDTRIPFYFVMPIFFGIALATVDRWMGSNPLVAILIGALAGIISSILALEVVRLAVIGVDQYVHGWRILGWNSEIANAGLASLILGGWLPGGIASLGRCLQLRRESGTEGR